MLAQVAEQGFRIENVDQGKFMRGTQTSQGIFRFRGRMRIVLPSGVILADSIVIDTDRGQILAKGNLEYVERGATSAQIPLKRFSYNIRRGEGELLGIDGRKESFRLQSSRLRKLDDATRNKDRVIADDIRVTPLGKGILPHYGFRAKRIWFYADGSFLARNLTYDVGGVPLIHFPLYYSGYLGSGVITQVGFSRQRGFFIQNTYQFARQSTNTWSPEFYRFKLDYYENTGELFGIELSRRKDPFDFFFNFDVARYKRYTLSTGNSPSVTNTVEVCRRQSGAGGSGNIVCAPGEDFIPSYKLIFLGNYKYRNIEEDRVRNVHVFFESYNNYLFDYEFGNRVLPGNSLAALYNSSLDSNRLPLKTQIRGSFQYTESIRDVSIGLRLERHQIWDNQIIFRESRYNPLLEILPEFTLNHRTEIGRVQGFDSPIYIHNDFQLRRSVSFRSGSVFDQVTSLYYDNGFRFFFPLLPSAVSLETRLGYGLRNSSVSVDTQNLPPELIPSGGTPAAIERDLQLRANRDSYLYAYTEEILTFGPADTFLRLSYRYKTPALARERQTILYDSKGFANNQHVNELEWLFEATPDPGVLIGLRSIYDLREFPTPVPSQQRWYYPVWDLQFRIDWLNPLKQPRENLLSRNRHQFLETVISNSYVYDTIRSRDHSNLFGVSFQLGGYDSRAFKRIRFIGLDFYWYHYYANNALDQVRSNFRIDVQLSKRIYWEMVIDSRVFRPEEIGSLNSFFQDIINGSGLNGPTLQGQTNLNIQLFDVNFIFDLEDWELRFGYELSQQNLLTGANSGSNFVVFYDSQLYMTFNFSRLELQSISGRPSRFILNRVRPY